jgi:hypothetical protein
MEQQKKKRDRGRTEVLGEKCVYKPTGSTKFL